MAERDKDAIPTSKTVIILFQMEAIIDPTVSRVLWPFVQGVYKERELFFLPFSSTFRFIPTLALNVDQLTLKLLSGLTTMRLIPLLLPCVLGLAIPPKSVSDWKESEGLKGDITWAKKISSDLDREPSLGVRSVPDFWTGIGLAQPPPHLDHLAIPDDSAPEWDQNDSSLEAHDGFSVEEDGGVTGGPVAGGDGIVSTLSKRLIGLTSWNKRMERANASRVTNKSQSWGKRKGQSWGKKLGEDVHAWLEEFGDKGEGSSLMKREEEGRSWGKRNNVDQSWGKDSFVLIRREEGGDEKVGLENRDESYEFEEEEEIDNL